MHNVDLRALLNSMRGSASLTAPTIGLIADGH